MSTPPLPPSDPSLAPYTPPAAGARLPWEERDRVGFLEALIQTIRLLVTDPGDAFSRLRPDGDLTSPILFGLILSWISVALSQIWQVLFGGFYGSFLEGIEGLEGAWAAPGIGAIVGTLIIWPILFIVGLFISAAILHVCLMIVGAAAQSPTGFEGTLKVVSYAQVAGIASVVPIVGSFIFAIWSLVLDVIGFAQAHRTTQGRALVAVLIPVILCCACLTLGAILFGAMIAAFFASWTERGGF
ncbi:MAG: YIP1 family protein [Vicinamibacteria bacterium]